METKKTRGRPKLGSDPKNPHAGKSLVEVKLSALISDYDPDTIVPVGAVWLRRNTNVKVEETEEKTVAIPMEIKE